ncbi:MAG: hypothetical protein ACR2P5_07090 [Gammaproteobacteria bacterium]
MSFLRRQESRVVNFCRKASPCESRGQNRTAANIQPPQTTRDSCLRRNDGGEERIGRLRFAFIPPQPPKGGETPPVCIPTLERRDEG